MPDEQTTMAGLGVRGRTYSDRLAAIPAAMRRGEEFRARVTDAEGDSIRTADLMAEAIQMAREAREFEVVGRDGRMLFAIEGLQAALCMDAARAAYLRARGSNA